MSKRQKKRNSLLLYEFLVRTISSALIEDNKKKSAIALKILRKHYKPGSELYKEFRLMNALAKTTVSSANVAASILKEARTAVCNLDSEKLDREKSLIIRNINHMINDEYFYDQQINEYRTYATIQSLVNEWLSKSPDLLRLAQSEDRVTTHLLTEKVKNEETVLTEESSGTARLLMKVMTKKLNEKYSGVLSEQQQAIVKAYAYAAASENTSAIKLKLEEVKKEIIGAIEAHSQTEELKHMTSKIKEAADMIQNENLDTIDDDTVTRFMLYSKLREELAEGKE